MFEYLGAQDFLGFGLVRNRDRHFRLDDRHQAVRQDLLADLELLRDDRGDARRIGRVDDRAHLGAEDALGHGALQQRVKTGNRLHQLHAVLAGFQALVDLQEGHDAALRPEILSGRNTVDRAVHGALKQDRADHLLAAEGGRLDDPGTHVVDQAIHFLVGRPRAFLDAVLAQRLGGRAARLVERGNEAGLLRHLPRHVCIAQCHRDIHVRHCPDLVFVCIRRACDQAASRCHALKQESGRNLGRCLNWSSVR